MLAFLKLVRLLLFEYYVPIYSFIAGKKLKSHFYFSNSKKVPPSNTTFYLHESTVYLHSGVFY